MDVQYLDALARLKVYEQLQSQTALGFGKLARALCNAPLSTLRAALVHTF